MSEILATNPSSSNPNKVYNIIKGDDGVIYCSCPGWKMRKTCKHLDEFKSKSSNKSSAWIVMELNWQYNDEYYYNTDDNGGTPQWIFLDRKKAEESALEQNIKYLSMRELRAYCENFSEILEINEDDFRRLIKNAGGTYNEDKIHLPKNLKRDDALKILAAINLRWFEVREAPLD